MAVSGGEEMAIRENDTSRRQRSSGRRQVALLATATLALAAGCSFWRSEVTVVNRTTQDIVVRFGYQFDEAVLVPGCGEVAFDPGVRHELPETPPTAVELQLRLGLPPDAPSRKTLVITSERVWTFPPSPQPPCEGVAPVPTPTPAPTAG
jgi:hypothetical protein